VSNVFPYERKGPKSKKKNSLYVNRMVKLIFRLLMAQPKEQVGGQIIPNSQNGEYLLF